MQRATVAQLAEQPLRKRRVKGSTPFGGLGLENETLRKRSDEFFYITVPQTFPSVSFLPNPNLIPRASEY